MDKNQKCWILTLLVVGMTTVLTTTAICTNEMLSNKYFAEHGYTQKVQDMGWSHEPAVIWVAPEKPALPQ